MILFSDIDGTLVSLKGEESPGVAEAIKEWRKQGNILVPITGRSSVGIAEIGWQYDFDNYYGVGANGAFLAHFQGEHYDIKDVSAYTEAEILSIARRFPDKARLRFEDYNNFRYKLTDYPTDYELWGGAEVVNVNELHLKGIVAAYYKVDSPVGLENKHLFEKDGHLWKVIDREGMHKGMRVPAISAMLGAHLSVYAVGDEVNDIPLFRAVRNSFVMGNAHDTVKRVAERQNLPILPTVQEGGVAHLIERLLSNGNEIR